MSMTGKAIHFPTVCNVCHILPKRLYKSVATCRDNIVFLHESEHTVFDMYLDRMEFDKLETEFPFCVEVCGKEGTGYGKQGND